MARYVVRVTAPGFDGVISDIRRTDAGIRSGLVEVANRIQNRLQLEVKQGTKRSGATGKLAQSITVESLPRDKGAFVGIGNMELMFQMAPYWFVVNYGARFPGSYDQAARGATGAKFIPPPNYGSFDGQAPRTGTPGIDKWTHTGNRGDFLLKPKKFTPINYIEKTVAWLSGFWTPFWQQKIQ